MQADRCRMIDKHLQPASYIRLLGTAAGSYAKLCLHVKVHTNTHTHTHRIQYNDSKRIPTADDNTITQADSLTLLVNLDIKTVIYGNHFDTHHRTSVRIFIVLICLSRQLSRTSLQQYTVI
jgi:hypothetical protein